MFSLSIQPSGGPSSSGSSSRSAATGAVAALNSPRMDDSWSRTDADTRETTESPAEAEQLSQRREEKKGWFWSQLVSRTGLFAPLAPEDSPEAVSERAKQEQERRRQEKLESVHRWRPSQDNTTSPQKERVTSSSHPSRPSMMKRLSSAVELKWWSGAPAGEGATEEEEEDLQKVKRSRGISQSSMSRSQDIPEGADGDIQLR